MILVWPDTGQSEAEVRNQLAGADDPLVVAMWDAEADDGGRTDLLTSVRDARATIVDASGDPDALVLVGFGRGAVAAAGLARYAKRLGIEFGRIVAVAGTWDEPDPFSGSPLAEVPERVELVEKADAYLQGAKGGELARLLRASKG